jgi:hypothetical protein
MPQTNPVGGLSLILHIVINIVIYSYKKIVKMFNLSNKNIVSRYFSFLVNKKGDTKIRRVLSYSIVALVSTTMSANLVFVTARLTNTDISYHAKKVEQSIQQYVSNSNIEINENNETIQDTDAIEINEISLVDFMRNSGIVDTSFDSRARLALKLGITNELESYKGTPKQNKSIMLKMNEGRMVLPGN